MDGTKSSKITLIIIGIIIGSIISVSVFYFLIYNSKPNVSKDELIIFKGLKEVFKEAEQLDKETDTRIYAPGFPHYKKEFVEFEENYPVIIGNMAEGFKIRDEYAEKNPEYKAYRNAVSEQFAKLEEWEDKIKEGNTLSNSLFQLVELGNKSGKEQSVFQEYAEASKLFWSLEKKYYPSQRCYRFSQLNKMDNCFTEYGDEDLEDLNEKRDATLLTVIVLQKRLETILKLE